MRKQRNLSRAFFIVLAFFFCQNAHAYFESYPPYKFKDGPPKSLESKPVVDLDHAEYRSKDGHIKITLKEINWNSKLLIKDGHQILMKLHVSEADDLPFPNAVYWVDIDGNGFKDVIVLSSFRGCGIAAHFDHVDIFLKKPNQSYQKISYDTLDADIHDFVTLNKNGEYEVIITGFYEGKTHNYFSYDIYEFKNYKLYNADKKFPGFQKYIWFTSKENDKDTTHLSKKERLEFTLKKDQSILVSMAQPRR